MSDLVLKKVTKIFNNKVVAVCDFDLRVESGEFMVLVGPSGCGKSTTLSMIAGLEDTTSGEIHIDNQMVNSLPPKDRNIAMVFQNYALYPHMKVYDNMAFSLKLRGWKKDDIQKHVYEAAEILELTEYLERLPKALSGGQRQRVALGRAIVRKPKVFLFDEPLSNLDAKMRTTMRVELKKLHERLGATMIYVTHDQTEAMTLGDRICVMNDGELQQMDTPLDVYNHPENIFVAGFIGSPQMNFIDGKLEQQENRFDCVTDQFRMRFELVPTSNGESFNHDIKVGIRPEKFFRNPLDKKSKNIIGRVSLIEPMGNETYIYLECSQQNLIARVKADNTFRIGDQIELWVSPDHCNIFNAKTGKRIFTKNIN